MTPAFQAVMFDLPRLEECPQLRRHREYTTFVVLCGSRVKPDLTGVKVNLSPFER
jgi:hypothetical protein